jgi:hypothetical protein
MNDESCGHDLSTARQKVVHDVNVFGWHVMQVLPGQAHPGWAYSIGLHRSFGHPEVVIFGLGLDTMGEIVNIVGRAVQSGRQFTDGTVTDELLAEYSCTLRVVDPVWRQRLLGFATWLYGGGEFPVLQVFWPDKERFYPWQPGFNAALVASQPLLFNADAVSARAQALLSTGGGGSHQLGADP